MEDIPEVQPAEPQICCGVCRGSRFIHFARLWGGVGYIPRESE
jgi:hypothetical protein